MSDTSSPIDIQHVKDQIGDSMELVKMLLDKYVKNQTNDLEALKAAFAEQDIGKIKKLAHKMKGAAAMIGAKELSQTCLELEKSPHDELEALHPYLQPIEDQTTRVIQQAEHLSETS